MAEFGSFRWRRGRDYLPAGATPEAGDVICLDYRLRGKRQRPALRRLQSSTKLDIREAEKAARDELNRIELQSRDGAKLFESEEFPTFAQGAMFYWEKRELVKPYISTDPAQTAPENVPLNQNSKASEWAKLKICIAHFGDMRMDAITRGDAKEFRKSLRVRKSRREKLWKDGYVNRIMGKGGQVYSFCISQEEWTYAAAPLAEKNRYGNIDLCVELQNPFHGLRRLPEESVNSVTPTPEQFRVFLGKLENPSNKHAAIIAAHTGLRWRNVFRLKWDQVSLGTGTLDIPSHKGSGSLVIELCPDLEELLQHLKGTNAAQSPYVLHRPWDGAPWTDTGKDWDNAAAAAGIPGFTFELTRRMFCSWGVESNVSLGLLQAALAHTTIATTAKHYNKAQAAFRVINRTMGQRRFFGGDRGDQGCDHGVTNGG
jgi:integrase